MINIYPGDLIHCAADRTSRHHMVFIVMDISMWASNNQKGTHHQYHYDFKIKWIDDGEGGYGIDDNNTFHGLSQSEVLDFIRSGQWKVIKCNRNKKKMI